MSSLAIEDIGLGDDCVRQKRSAFPAEEFYCSVSVAPEARAGGGVMGQFGWWMRRFHRISARQFPLRLASARRGRLGVIPAFALLWRGTAA